MAATPLVSPSHHRSSFGCFVVSVRKTLLLRKCRISTWTWFVHITSKLLGQVCYWSLSGAFAYHPMCQCIRIFWTRHEMIERSEQRNTYSQLNDKIILTIATSTAAATARFRISFLNIFHLDARKPFESKSVSFDDWLPLSFHWLDSIPTTDDINNHRLYEFPFLRFLFGTSLRVCVFSFTLNSF